MHLSGHYRHCSEDCRRCLAGRRCSRGSETTGVYAPPLLAVHAFVQRKSRFFTVERTTCTRSGGREPAVADGRCTCRGDSANVRETADGVPADAGAVAVAKPRGVYAPRSWLCTRLCSAKVAFSPSSERRAPGAAGVTRRGGRAMHLSGHYRHCSEDCRRCLAGRRCSRGSETTGGLRPPALGCTRVCAAQKSLFHRRANDVHQERWA